MTLSKRPEVVDAVEGAAEEGAGVEEAPEVQDAVQGLVLLVVGLLEVAVEPLEALEEADLQDAHHFVQEAGHQLVAGNMICLMAQEEVAC